MLRCSNLKIQLNVIFKMLPNQRNTLSKITHLFRIDFEVKRALRLKSISKVKKEMIYSTILNIYSSMNIVSK